MMVTKKILEILQGGAETTDALLDVFLSGYHESYRKARRALRGAYYPRRPVEIPGLRERQQFYAMMYHLKCEGLVQKTKRGRKTWWKITKGGLEKLRQIAKRGGSAFLRRRRLYQGGPDAVLKVVIFDVPERERWKRVWLRTALLALGFSLLQKSVWVGKRKIPEEFLEDLRAGHMMDYVHIFEITKRGTIFEVG